ncbi:Fur family transcriptional regulator, peroxide stress response regulator [Pseudobutyrivibrio ruminis]|uniref:Fur family transcriptional regulator, peroxide stress response regulator n=2 Tax=Pseudobutyrivibrio ruminis TaxID=46206 RepID=A0A1H7EWB2_9FIRM|nr:transcriptional repressor [Pseudobutyrivibrio ruminis]SEK17904.1 Fur family transcriptional regulator, peroxide stress response regulator [Pseudobutyrivibrio ruminis]SOC01729.1 Fur family transcriptional regulator, peroxide stress response regulator [Pseudobutyrivibrio ruminis DSM 9787]
MNYSRQRESIKEYLMSTKEHPTADVIYQHVREENPKISLGTVYRNLTLLVELGEVRKISTGDGTDHFDADTSAHSHYFCRCCHRLMDVDVTPSVDQILAASSAGIGTVEQASLLFTGICKDCVINNETNNNG